MKRINKKDYELYKSFFKDYEDFKETKKHIEIYDFHKETEETFNEWLKHSYALKVERPNEWEHRKQQIQKRVIITKLYF